MKKAVTIFMIFAGIFLLAVPMIIKKIRYQTAASSIGIIGGADGPTAIFVAGTVGSGAIWMAVMGVALIIAAIILIRRKNR